jgi:dienelactone hydrolase
MPELEQVPATWPAPEIATTDGLRALYYEGLPLHGKATRIFVLYAAPAGANPANKVPGIVLVHGSGGTAFSDWVKLWRDRGYAAIAMDHDGGIPLGKTGAWQAAPGGGSRFQGVAQASDPVSGQWMYHAVADAIIAHSLLRSFPEVDPDRTGITGISWGGVITSTVAGIDSRFKFAAPVYGCGYISDPPAPGLANDGSCFVGETSPPLLRARWRQLWDPANYLPRANIPMLWVTGTNDFAFTLSALRRSVQATPVTHTLGVRPRMLHGHGGPGESSEEIRVFVDSILKGGPPLVRIVRQGQDANGTCWADYDAPASITLRSAELLSTHNLGLWQNRWWSATPATIDPVRHRITTTPPAGAAHWFINITDTRGLVTSSLLSGRDPETP